MVRRSRPISSRQAVQLPQLRLDDYVTHSQRSFSVDALPYELPYNKINYTVFSFVYFDSHDFTLFLVYLIKVSLPGSRYPFITANCFNSLSFY
jgi:hypothetical protein